MIDQIRIRSIGISLLVTCGCAIAAGTIVSCGTEPMQVRVNSEIDNTSVPEIVAIKAAVSRRGGQLTLAPMDGGPGISNMEAMELLGRQPQAKIALQAGVKPDLVYGSWTDSVYSTVDEKPAPTALILDGIPAVVGWFRNVDGRTMAKYLRGGSRDQTAGPMPNGDVIVVLRATNGEVLMAYTTASDT